MLHHGAAKKARSEAEQHAAAAEAELKAVRAELGARVAQLEGDLSQRLQQAHSLAEERLEQQTEAYRCQVRAQQQPCSPAIHLTAVLRKGEPG